MVQEARDANNFRTFLNKNKLWFIACSAVLLVLFGLLIYLGVAYWTVKAGEDTFYGNISINELELRGMTQQEARTELDQITATKLDNLTINVRYEDQNWTINAKSIAIPMNLDKQLNVAWQKCRTGNFLSRYEDIQYLKQHPLDMETAQQYDEAKLGQMLATMKMAVEREMVNAGAKLNSDGQTFTYSEAVVGRQVDLNSLVDDVHAMLMKEEGGTLELPVTIIEPKVTVDELKAAKENRIARFNTTINPTSTQARRSNIRLAFSKFNGKVLLPGERISFNETTGERSKENGYRDAPTILVGDYVDGPGGGVCQVSTTLYQAWLHAGLKVAERTRHTIPASYVPIGMDAVVDFGYLDLVLENDSDMPVFILCGVDGDQTYASIFGRPLEAGVTIKVESQVVKESPAPDAIIKEDNNGVYARYTDEQVVASQSRKGFESITNRVWYKDGKEIKREQVAHDYYQPIKGTIWVGVHQRGAE